ncbi:MAG: class I SAM-dependent methyltransferase [Alphaproteobacteria bacterium]|nr:class I SAM-dependent methyltransferase [Alphaproteobacteria bacterium]
MLFSNQPKDITDVVEDRSFRAFHTFMRTARAYQEAEVYDAAWQSYRRALERDGRDNGRSPKSAEDALTVLDDLAPYQLYSWMYRHLQRFKYNHPDWGLQPKAESEAARIVPELDRAAAESIKKGTLRLNPNIEYPDYYRLTDFHQHPGGVWTDDVDGLIYELGRRTTRPHEDDPNDFYRLTFTYLPKRKYPRVLDWGTGQGGMALTWLEGHPDSEVHAVDISAPCLKLLNKRAIERGITIHLSQQAIEKLDYPDNHFDLILFTFMLHEIPPNPTRGILAEVHRVLKPGGIFCGNEFLPREDSPFNYAMMLTTAWTNNEPFAPAFYKYPYTKVAKEMGFSKADIVWFDKIMAPVSKDPAVAPRTKYPIYMFEK